MKLYKQIIFILVVFFKTETLLSQNNLFNVNNIELVKKDNLAVAITMSGYYLASLSIFIGALLGPTNGFAIDLVLVGGYSILGLVLLNLSRYINDKVILRKFCNIEQLTQNNNLAVAAVQFGTYLATGLVIAGAVTGTGGGVHTAIVFFTLGQISLLAFSFIYNAITPYCIHEELGKKNLAVGIALSGGLIAVGIIILNAISIDFISWKESLTDFLIVNIVAFVFLPLIRFIMDRVTVPGDKLSCEIIEDKNIGAGFLEATVAISFAVILKVLL